MDSTVGKTALQDLDYTNLVREKSSRLGGARGTGEEVQLSPGGSGRASGGGDIEPGLKH